MFSGMFDFSKVFEFGGDLLIFGCLNVEKVLVIIIDVKLGSNLIKVKLLVEFLDDKDICVFVVFFGNEVDLVELEIVFGLEKNVINFLSIDDLGRMREEIMDKIR